MRTTQMQANLVPPQRAQAAGRVSDDISLEFDFEQLCLGIVESLQGGTDEISDRKSDVSPHFHNNGMLLQL